MKYRAATAWIAGLSSVVLVAAIGMSRIQIDRAESPAITTVGSMEDPLVDEEGALECPPASPGAELSDEALGPVVGSGSLSVSLNGLEDVVAHADFIIHGVVTDITQGRVNERIGFHNLHIEPREAIKGNVAADPFMFERPACHLPTGREFELEGQLDTDVGDEVIVFLRRGASTAAPPVVVAGSMNFRAEDGTVIASGRSGELIRQIEDRRPDVDELRAEAHGRSAGD